MAVQGIDLAPGTSNEVKTRSKSKRYNLVLPKELYREVEQLADEEDVTVVELIRRFIKLGLLITRILRQPNGAVILREGNTERELVFL